jgi:multiple sugar transport system substrate-binding protein
LKQFKSNQISAVIIAKGETKAMSKSMMRYSWLVILLLVATISLATKSIEATSIILWHTGTQDEIDAINTVAKDFTQATGIEVKGQAFSWNEARTKYLVSIAAGVTPDMGTMGSTWPTYFGLKGGMVNLMKDFPAQTKKIMADTFPGALPSAEYKGAVYGLRYDMTTLLLYVRTDILAQMGLSIPTTWGELTAIIPKLKAKGKEFVIGWGNKEWIGASPFISQAGGDIYNSDGTASALISPKTQQGLKFFTELYTKYGVPHAVLDAFTGFASGEYPLIIDGDWIGPTLDAQSPEIKGKWTVAVLPKGKVSNAGFIGGRNIGIFANSKHKKEAMEFLAYLSTPEVQKRIFNILREKAGGILLPPNMKAWNIIGLDKNYAMVLKKQLAVSKSPRFVIGGDESYQYLNNALSEIILQGVDFNKAIDKAVTKTNTQMQFVRKELGR